MNKKNLESIPYLFFFWIYELACTRKHSCYCSL